MSVPYDTERAETEMRPEVETLARIEAVVSAWEVELESGAIRDPDARYCWGLAAQEIRAVLDGPQ